MNLASEVRCAIKQDLHLNIMQYCDWNHICNNICYLFIVVKVSSVLGKGYSFFI